ncbi:hypothetical protein B0J12DRAFT_276442 [Macrophomina phaseolina]|uniref:Uncharacterized protein n=1 Tax=Macrophomina phaseolina TaxID=35725 RepID=A0ABQ8FYE5_9PEZI|nr:hypothetical protein B0J12DRAFT_276442 [Macrophomina phaseolina]
MTKRTRRAALARAPTEAYSSATTTIAAPSSAKATAKAQRSPAAPQPHHHATAEDHDDDEDYDTTDVETDPFPFFALPAEIRLRVYEELLTVPTVIDLDPVNYRRIWRRALPLYLTSHRMHEEAYRVFYGANQFRLFPLHGRFFHTKKPLLARLPPRYRNSLTRLELRLGPGWQGPLPRCWDLSPEGAEKLGLADLREVRSLKVFVECDPASDEIFRGFRRSDDFFTAFCGDLLRSLLLRVPGIEEVQFDGFPSVTKDSPLMTELMRQVTVHGKRITYGPERGWADKIVELETGIARLHLWSGKHS